MILLKLIVNNKKQRKMETQMKKSNHFSDSRLNSLTFNNVVTPITTISRPIGSRMGLVKTSNTDWPFERAIRE